MMRTRAMARRKQGAGNRERRAAAVNASHTVEDRLASGWRLGRRAYGWDR